MKRGSRNKFVVIGIILFCVMLICSCESRPLEGETMLRERIARLGNAQNAEVLAREQAWFCDSLDVGSLRNSPLWNDYIGAWVASFAKKDSIVPASEKLLGRVVEQNPQAFKLMVQDICRVLKDRGARKSAIEIACLPYGIDASQNPEIAARLLTSTLLTGQPAPPLATGDGAMIHLGSDGQQTILFFYESRCRTCQAMIARLSESYGELQASGVRVITHSSDTDRKLFAENSRQFPWKDKLCDFSGFNSPAFVNYGVAGTPTTFLINEEGVVGQQYESVEELLNVIRTKRLEHDLTAR